MKYWNRLLTIFIMFLLKNIYAETVQLPPPDYKGRMSLEEAIYKRQSIRSYSSKPISLNQLSQLLWATGGVTADGITGPTYAYPSAGGIYPLEIYVVVGTVNGIKPGIYRYNSPSHSLELKIQGDKRNLLSRACYYQKMMINAPITIILTARISATTSRYGQRGYQYIFLDAGHCAENICLQATALGLGTVPVGAFSESAVNKLLKLSKEYTTVYILPVGRIK